MSEHERYFIVTGDDELVDAVERLQRELEAAQRVIEAARRSVFTCKRCEYIERRRETVCCERCRPLRDALAAYDAVTKTDHDS